MESNFQFLLQDQDTQVLYDTVHAAEQLYTMGMFDNELESLRKVAENVARQLLDLNYVAMREHSTFNDCLREIRNRQLTPSKIVQDFYDLKGSGNGAAHTLHKYGKGEALNALHQIYNILVWFGKMYMDEEVSGKFFEPKREELYKTTADRKLIYVQTGNNPMYQGLEKVGDAKVDGYEVDNRPNSDDLRKAAKKRIDQYMKTAGVSYDLQWAELAYRKLDGTWFRDYDVHEVLERSGVKKSELTEGNEWFQTDVETAKQAIKAVKEGRDAIDAKAPKMVKIKLRPEQQEAVKKTKKAFKKGDRMLWNAKMRFGKTLSALQLIKDEKYQHVLIMTHRPVVDTGWFEDFNKLGMPKAGYQYGSKKVGERIDNLVKSDQPYIYFASLQDLRDSDVIGGHYDKNHAVFDNQWDLVIIDEAHEGTQTDLAKQVIDVVVGPETKLLELSGTPFNILDQYNEDQVYTWDYVQEQQEKAKWADEHPGEKNPYAGLPKVSMYTFEMSKNFKEAQFISDDKRAFNFKEFFRTDEQGKFVYEAKVKQFLRNITTPDSKTNYPFSTKEFRNQLRHTLWILPGVKEANALEDLMKQDPVFGMEYTIVNVVRDGDEDGVASESDLERVKKAMHPDPATTKTITLTVRKMTTGVTIKPWTGVIFLSNTNSAMQYLQAAFRAQTPYSSPTFGEKTNCYIFDFAPDRALTVMAEAAQLSTGVGKRTSGAQKQQMSELLNFLPIIGETGQGMKPFQVDTMLAKLKRVYAEKAVRTGFDDDSLYSDELLMLDNVDLDEFNELKAIVGTTKAEKKKLEVDINQQGLTDEEYDQANRAKKKSKKKRTDEEQAALDKMNELKKQRKTMISILRSISIRIPMMIYGMNIDINQDVDIHKFVDLVDDLSWQEFMPKGVTKELFKKFIKYYDPDVFIEAGRIIRRKAKALDKLSPIERAEQLALIFGTFRNPDKETVLTPWRVVNMHLGKTLGGYSFYDENYKYTTIDGKRANHWIQTEYTDKVITPYTHILEINSKTGLYPLYAAVSLFYQAELKLNEDTAGKFGHEDELMIWQQILRENIFVVAKTPMAKAIAKRTLAGYLDMDTNIEFVDNIVADTKTNAKTEAKKIKGLFGNMKFDVVIGNPPYQQSAKGESTRDEPIYHNFMDLSYDLADLVTLITPGRFLFNAGQTPKSWNQKMLNDEHLKVIMYEKDSSKIFPRTEIKGGIVITLHDNKHSFGKIGTFTPYEQLNTIIKKVWKNNPSSFSGLVSSRGNYRFSPKFFEDFPKASERLGKGTGNMIVSNSFEKLPEAFEEDDPKSNNYLKLLGRLNNHRLYRWIKKEYVLNNDYIDAYKVVITESNGSGTFGESLSTPLINIPFVGATDTFISVGPFENEITAKSALKYVKTKFVRAMLGVKKATQHNPRNTWAFVPLQDFTSNSDIDWFQSIADIDQQLYKKYGLSKDEIDFIETKVQAMD